MWQLGIGAGPKQVAQGRKTAPPTESLSDPQDYNQYQLYNRLRWMTICF